MTDPEALANREGVTYSERTFTHDSRDHCEADADGRAIVGVTNDDGAAILWVNDDAEHVILPNAVVGEDSAFDPDRFAERFELLIEGENLLSYDRIQDALGTWPQSVWSVVDKPDKRWAWRHFPLVFVPK